MSQTCCTPGNKALLRFTDRIEAGTQSGASSLTSPFLSGWRPGEVAGGRSSSSLRVESSARPGPGLTDASRTSIGLSDAVTTNSRPPLPRADAVGNARSAPYVGLLSPPRPTVGVLSPGRPRTPSSVTSDHYEHVSMAALLRNRLPVRKH